MSLIMDVIGMRSKISIIFYSFIGFLLSCWISYPYHLHWDTAFVFSKIFVDGHAELSVWQGWYFPLLWEFLYKITHITTIMGIYITALYWFGATFLYFGLFNEKKNSRLAYWLFVYFPGSVIFLFSITNNALYFVTLLFGLASYVWYRKHCRKWYWLFLGFFFIAQCILIRRESLFFILPLLILLVFVELRPKWKLFPAAILSSSAVFFSAFLFHFGERMILEKINPDYYTSFNTIGYTALYDFSCMSFYKGKNVIPLRYLKPIFRDNPNAVLKYLPDVSKPDTSDYSFRDFYSNVLDSPATGRIPLHFKEIIPVYQANLIYYIQHRLHFISSMLYQRSLLVSKIGAQSDFQNFVPPASPKLAYNIGIAWTYFPPACIYYFSGILFLICCFCGKINFSSNNEKIILCGLVCCVIVASGITMLGALSPQIRYLSPLFLLIYYAIIYVVFSRKTTTEKQI